MLKAIRYDGQIRLEAMAQSLETWLDIRVMIAVGCGERLLIEPGHLTLDLPQLQDPGSGFPGGRIRLDGVWLRSDPDSKDGVLAAPMSPTLAEQMVHLWSRTQFQPQV